MQEIFIILMFVSTIGLLMVGFPVAFTLAGSALIWALIGFAVGLVDLSFLGAIPSRIYGNAMTNSVLVAVPLFVFMGVVLERSRVAESLLDTMGRLFGPMRGGLGISVVLVGALMAASTGIVGATVVTMGLLSLPTMLKRNYSPSLACGAICASGTLGQIIPPSIVLVILGDQLSNSYVEAQRRIGNWSPEPVSVGDLFSGALLPGLLLVGMYIVYQLIMAVVRPESCPAIPRDAEQAPSLKEICGALFPPLILVFAVLGSILMGVATPTEAAAVGAVGALMLAGVNVTLSERKGTPIQIEGEKPALPRVLHRVMGFLDHNRNLPIYGGGLALVVMLLVQNAVDLRLGRAAVSTTELTGIIVVTLALLVLVWSLFISLWRVFRTGILTLSVRSTMHITSMVFVILIGATIFSLVFRAFGGDEIVSDFLISLPGGFVTQLLVVMAVMFILGFFLDFIEIIFVVVPIVAPVLLQHDISPVWLGVMMAVNLQTSFLTPPFGFALFYLRGVAPPSVSTWQIYRGVVPFIVIQLICLVVVAAFPQLADWLPEVIFGTSYD
ncbi:MAG: TRAP transporter large permease subunit [Alphaproteobacteria bacterium]|nr:TRAP transporter large permease subunit [Alphaproteobacteria bacterium]